MIIRHLLTISSVLFICSQYYYFHPWKILVNLHDRNSINLICFVNIFQRTEDQVCL